MGRAHYTPNEQAPPETSLKEVRRPPFVLKSLLMTTRRGADCLTYAGVDEARILSSPPTPHRSIIFKAQLMFLALKTKWGKAVLKPGIFKNRGHL